MTHRQRLSWLTEHGFIPLDRTVETKELGFSLWMTGQKDNIEESFWLSVRDGSAVIHFETTPVKSWEELQAWIQEKPPEAKKPLAAQRNLFDLDSD